MAAFERSDIAPFAAPFSAGQRAGDFVFVSGQIATRPDGTVIVGDFAAEVNQAVNNVEAILREVGANLGHVVKVNAWLSNALLFEEFNAVYRQRVATPPPARTTVVVGFAHPDVRVEIDAIAYLSPDPAGSPGMTRPN